METPPPIKDISDLHAAVGRENLLTTLASQCVPVTAADLSAPSPATTASQDDAARTQEAQAAAGRANPAAPVRYEDNDAGRARRFIDRHADDLRFVPKWQSWLVWSGHHWRRDDSGAVMRLAVQHGRQLLAEACQGGDDEDSRRARVKRALELGDVGVIEAMLKIARADERMVVSHQAIDGDPYLLGVRNGVVDLRTGAFRAGERGDLVMKRGGASWEEGAQCRRWRVFLEECMGGDAEMVTYLQKLAGYTLTADVSAQCFFFLYGEGDNGKTVFTETLAALLGEYVVRLTTDALTSDAAHRDPERENAKLVGARLAIASEVQDGSRFAEARLKDITGGDTLAARFLYSESFQFAPRHKLWIYGNYKPEIRGTDHGIWRRVRLIPFTVKVPPERVDPELCAKLLAELPGILAWAVEGALRWKAEGLTPPAAVRQASEEYREQEDVLGDFLREEVTEEPGGRVARADMYERYKSWCDRNGNRYPFSQRTLTRRLLGRGFKTGKSGGRYWEDIGLA